MSGHWMDAAGDAAVDYTVAFIKGMLLSDWDGIDDALYRLCALSSVLCPLAIAASSGAANETEFYTSVAGVL